MFGWGVKTISTDELADKLAAGRPALIDVREPHEFAAGHVPGAKNIPLRSLRTRLADLDPTAETLLICQSGNRSKTAARQLAKAGFTDAYSVRGGTLAWRGRLEK
jgi:rhodanese-related sulfurtransferase